MSARLWDRFRKAAYDQPVLTFSMIVGTIGKSLYYIYRNAYFNLYLCLGPVLVLFNSPIRRLFNLENAPPLPQSYPLPNRPRNPPPGYDD
jgi:hypothetical protein